MIMHIIINHIGDNNCHYDLEPQMRIDLDDMTPLIIHDFMNSLIINS